MDIVNINSSFDYLKNENVQIIKGYITKIPDWDNITGKIDTVYHLGAINGTKFFYEIPEKVLEVNVQGIFNALEFVRKNDVNEILFTSSSEVYGFPKVFPTSEKEELTIPDPYNPRFSYSGSKIVGELFCINYSKKYGFKHTIVRYHNVYGPQMGHEHVMPQLIKKIALDQEFVVEGDGTETRSFCYIDDAIDGTLIVQNDNSCTNRIFNIGNCEEISISNLIENLSKISNKKIVPKYLPKSQPGTQRRVPDISKARSIGYEPKIPLSVGLRSTFDWYYSHYKRSN